MRIQNRVITRIMWQGMLLLVGLFASSFVFADATFFSPALKDRSISMLSTIFGQVGGWVFPNVLTGKYTIFGAMFRVFNSALIIFGTLVGAYTTIKTVVGLANEGESMQQQGGASIWSPIRSATALLSLIPAFSGYSAIQLAMMWVIVTSISVADTMWDKIVDYMSSSTSVVAPVSSTAGSSLTLVSNAFYGLSCLHRAEKEMGKSTIGTDTRTYSILQDKITGRISFDLSYTGEGVTIDCGSISIPGSDDPNLTKTGAAKYKALASGVTAMLDFLNIAAMEYIYNGEQITNVAVSATGDILNDASALLDAALLPVAKQVVDNETNMENFWKEIKSFGWIYAGAYYHQLASLNNNVDSLAQSYDVQYESPKVTSLLGNRWYRTKQDTTQMESLMRSALDVTLNAAQQAGSTGQGNSFFLGGNGDSRGGFSLLSFLTDIQNWFDKQRSTIFLLLITGGKSTSITQAVSGNNVDPLVRVQVFGRQLSNFVVVVMGILMVSLFTLGLIMGLLQAFLPFGDVLSVLVKYGIMPSLIIYGLMYFWGIMMAVYVPLIPFFVFTIGAIGWVISVIETMLAAPLVAIGLAGPLDKHTAGRAMPAVNLLMNVFLKPTLMLIGLVAGMVLSYVAVEFLNTLYMKVAMDSMSGASTGSTGKGMMEFIMYMFIYGGILLAILNRCFSLIHVIPTVILRWIGNDTSLGDKEFHDKDLKALEGAAHSTAKTGGDTITKAAGGAGSAGQQAGKAAGDGGKKVGEAAVKIGAAVL